MTSMTWMNLAMICIILLIFPFLKTMLEKVELFQDKYALYETGVGVGDKLLDITGIFTIGEFKGAPVNVYWGRKGFRFYDHELIQIHHSSYTLNAWDGEHVNLNETLVKWNQSGKISPITIQNLLGIPDLEIQNVIDTYFSMSACIQPAPDVEMFIPSEITDCVGIHLRRSDKVDVSSSISMSSGDYGELMEQLRETVYEKVMNGEWLKFYICSEEEDVKAEFIGWIQGLRTDVHIVDKSVPMTYEHEHIGFNDVVDLFSLAKCRCILQGIIYSSFSVFAAIHGKVPLYNFTQQPPNDWLMKMYMPLLYLVHNGVIFDHVIDLDELKTHFSHFTPTFQTIDVST